MADKQYLTKERLEELKTEPCPTFCTVIAKLTWSAADCSTIEVTCIGAEETSPVFTIF